MDEINFHKGSRLFKLKNFVGILNKSIENMKASYIQAWQNKMLEIRSPKLEIKKGGLQKLRKTHNTMLKENGLPLDWILHQLGHSEERVNKNHYTGKFEVDLSKMEVIA